MTPNLLVYLMSIKCYTLKHVFDKLCETDFSLDLCLRKFLTSSNIMSQQLHFVETFSVEGC